MLKRAALFCLMLTLLPRAAWGGPIRVSVASDGTEGNSDAALRRPSLSSDGRYVAFSSAASNLVPGDTNGTKDVFVHDRQTGTTERVSVASGGAEGNSDSDRPSISADGRYVAFFSVASNLVPGDTNSAWDIFVHDRQTGATERVSMATGGAEGNGWSQNSSLSADGRYVAFVSAASNLVPEDTNGKPDAFVHDRQTGATERVSVATGGAEGNSDSDRPSISADGRYVAFFSVASNLVPGDTNSAWDIFVHDRQTGATERVSMATGGAEGNNGSAYPSISADGRYVAFESTASNLVSGDTNGSVDIFVHDRQTGATNRASTASDGTQGNGSSYYPSLSADGSSIAFPSVASNLVPGDTNGFFDIFETENTLYSEPKPDSDGDGVPDSLDGCPSDAQKTVPGVCGCGAADTDSDGDGAADCMDSCPSDPTQFTPGAECAGSTPSPDADGDGTTDNLDACPNDFNKTLDGATGCGALDPLMPTTVLEEYARVSTKGKNVTVMMERFSGVVLTTAAAPGIRYVAELRRVAAKGAAISSARRTVQRRISRKNKVVFRRLAPGAYQVRYLAQAVQQKKVLFQTNWSPVTQVTVGKR